MAAPTSNKPASEADSPQLDEKFDLDVMGPDGHTPLASEFLHLSRWQATKVFWRATMCCFFAGVCVLMEGYQGSVAGSIVSNVGFIDQFGTLVEKTGKKALAAEFVSAWGGTGAAFGILGHQLITLVADKWGRRVAFALAAIAVIAGVLVEQFVTTMPGWLGAKMVAGLAGGMGQATSLLYISEVAPVQNRGALLCCYGLFLALGQLSSAIALEIVNVTNPHHWRLAIYSEWVLVGLFLLCLPFIVESPWYYARKGLDEQAKAALRKLNGGVEGYNVEHEYLVMKTELEQEQAARRNIGASTYQEIFMGTNFRRTMASFFGVIMLQWSGASVVFSYATYFLQQAGIKKPFQATCIVYSLLVAMVIVSFYTTERFGRRTLIFTGGTGCFVCNVILGALGTLKRTDAVLNATLGVICIWVLFYAGCLAGVGWGLTSEISTPRLRARTTGVVVSMSMCFSLMFGYTVPLMLAATGKGARNWGVKTMFLFACLGGIGLVVNFFILPEVGGRTFSEVDEMYEKGVPPRKMKDRTPSTSDRRRRAPVQRDIIARSVRPNTPPVPPPELESTPTSLPPVAGPYLVHDRRCHAAPVGRGGIEGFHGPTWTRYTRHALPAEVYVHEYFMLDQEHEFLFWLFFAILHFAGPFMAKGAPHFRRALDELGAANVAAAVLANCPNVKLITRMFTEPSLDREDIDDLEKANAAAGSNGAYIVTLVRFLGPHPTVSSTYIGLARARGLFTRLPADREPRLLQRQKEHHQGKTRGRCKLDARRRCDGNIKSKEGPGNDPTFEEYIVQSFYTSRTTIPRLLHNVCPLLFPGAPKPMAPMVPKLADFADELINDGGGKDAGDDVDSGAESEDDVVWIPTARSHTPAARGARPPPSQPPPPPDAPPPDAPTPALPAPSPPKYRKPPYVFGSDPLESQDGFIPDDDIQLIGKRQSIRNVEPSRPVSATTSPAKTRVSPLSESQLLCASFEFGLTQGAEFLMMMVGGQKREQDIWWNELVNFHGIPLPELPAWYKTANTANGLGLAWSPKADDEWHSSTAPRPIVEDDLNALVAGVAFVPVDFPAHDAVAENISTTAASASARPLPRPPVSVATILSTPAPREPLMHGTSSSAAGGPSTVLPATTPGTPPADSDSVSQATLLSLAHLDRAEFLARPRQAPRQPNTVEERDAAFYFDGEGEDQFQLSAEEFFDSNDDNEDDEDKDEDDDDDEGDDDKDFEDDKDMDVAPRERGAAEGLADGKSKVDKAKAVVQAGAAVNEVATGPANTQTETDIAAEQPKTKTPVETEAQDETSVVTQQADTTEVGAQTAAAEAETELDTGTPANTEEAAIDGEQVTTSAAQPATLVDTGATTDAETTDEWELVEA
ncbi:hypothetical protein Q8F55_001634 [Vanrija albida]|uniref:Major facilitator superfamily (MFS) profile domain-containing protein n=1 Tax=Vanrija albida TaxID=181172 RepID=A0ABR3Q881_9TREE